MFTYHRHFLAVAALVGVSACAPEPQPTIIAQPTYDKFGNPEDEGCPEGTQPVPGTAPLECIPDIPEDRGDDPNDDPGRDIDPTQG